MSNEIDTAVNDILSQIKSHNKDTTEIKKVAEEIDLENLEEFLVKKTSSLINSSVDMVDDVKEYNY